MAKAKLMLATRSMNSGGMKPLVAPSTARFVGESVVKMCHDTYMYIFPSYICISGGIDAFL